MQYFLLLFSYLSGSLSFAIITSRVLKLSDPRSYGSKNAGATNVMRSGNKTAAALTLLGDFLKGLLIVLFAKFLIQYRGLSSNELVAICGILVVIGHIYPIFFRFKGGKGVATALGVFCGFSLVLVIFCALVWLLTFKITKISSLSALVMLILAPLFAYFWFGWWDPYFMSVVVLSCFVLYRHKENILRLVAGGEHKFNKIFSEADTPNKED